MWRCIPDRSLAVCEAHLDRTMSRNTEIEAYLVRFLLVQIYAEFEARVKLAIRRRAEKTGDAQVVSYVESAAPRLLHGLRIRDLCGVLKHFAPELKERFGNRVRRADMHVSYDNILNNRHAFAHGDTVQMTFGDLKNDYPKGKKVIEEFARVLGVSLAARAKRGAFGGHRPQ